MANCWRISSPGSHLLFGESNFGWGSVGEYVRLVRMGSPGSPVVAATPFHLKTGLGFLLIFAIVIRTAAAAAAKAFREL
jgi:hypothetical protein